MVRQKSQRHSEILQKLHGVERELSEVIKQAHYRERFKDTCLLQGYCDGKISLILHFEANWKINGVSTLHAARHPRGTLQQFTILISYPNVQNEAALIEGEKQQVLVGNIEIVKCPYQGIGASLVWLDFGNDAIKSGLHRVSISIP